MGTTLRSALRNADLIIACAAIAALIVITVLGVVMRYAVGTPLIWLEEVQLALIVWVTMLGGSFAFRVRGHVAVDAVFNVFSERGQTVLRWIIAAFCLVLLALLTWIGLKFVLFQAGANRVTDVLRIPYALVYAAVPVGGVLMIANFLCVEVLPLARGRAAR
ncbi:MAG: TRAP transporter small permease [Tropicimonas sp.]|uniref:TRAP transporter small permease n=1 Tax=Tropicimonas sp. TaxID=2067044 RepID=UPI003A863DCD